MDALLSNAVSSLSRWLLRVYPFRRGRTRLYNLLYQNDLGWPEAATFDFRFGRFINASVRRWPYGYRELSLRGIKDDCEVVLLFSVLREGDWVVDGGANIGYISLVMSQAVGASGRVFAFEPVPSTARALRTNVAASRRNNVIVVEAALSNTSGTCTLNVFDDDPVGIQSSVAARPGLSGRRTVTARNVRLDDFLFSQESYRCPALIKLDVEGTELPALQGSQRLLEERIGPLIYFEWNVATARGMGYHPQEALDFLKGYGYVPYLAGPGSDQSRPRLVPFRARTDLAEWTPMVWCVKPEIHKNRLAGLL
jgi:FkbM family methyltransferase